MSEEDFDKVYWEWRCSLFPLYTAPKIDASLQKCDCGYSWHFSKLNYIRMILFGKYIVTCPRCQRKHYYRMANHTIKEADKTRTENNELTERKQRIWKNG